MAKNGVAAAPGMPWRLVTVVGLLLILAASVVGRLVLIQVVDQERGAAFLREQGAMRAVRSAEIPAYRGMVTDRRGEPLAISTPVITLWADPQRLRESGRLGVLANALGQSELELQQRLELYSDKRFMYLARHQTPDLARRVLGLKIVGVGGKREYRRFYPAG